METTTKGQLENLLSRINTLKGFDNPKYSEVGSYTLDWAYGGCQLQKFTNEQGGINNITSGFIPKKELYDQMKAFLLGMES